MNPEVNSYEKLSDALKTECKNTYGPLDDVQIKYDDSSGMVTLLSKHLLIGQLEEVVKEVTENSFSNDEFDLMARTKSKNTTLTVIIPQYVHEYLVGRRVAW